MPRTQREPSAQEEGRARPVVIVTGSSGLLGARICRELERDHDVVRLDKEPPEGPAQSTWIEVDLTDDESVRDALSRVRERWGERLASVVHLAAYYDFSGEPSPLYDELTVGGTRRLLATLKEKFTLEQFVFSSSLLVMAPSEPGHPLTEDSPVDAEWAYPQSKLEAEAAIEAERGPIHAVLLRIAGVYDEDGNSLPIAQQIKRIREKQLESYLFPGNSQHGQSFVHIDDVVRCVRAAVERRGELGPVETFLIGEPDVMSYAELQDTIGEVLHGKEWPTLRIPGPVAKAGAWVQDKTPGVDSFIKPWMVDLADAHMPVSPQRAREKLDWKPRHRLRDTLPEMLERLKRDPDAWYERHGFEPPGGTSSAEGGQ